MASTRASGVLLHPTSLPGPYGIGDIGPEAMRWIDFLAESGCALWQVLPHGPTSFGDSPYQCFSAFAGNPFLISPDGLLADGLLTAGDLDPLPPFPSGLVDYGAVIPWKIDMVGRAYHRFRARAPGPLAEAFADFQEANRDWLDDFALFMVIKDGHGGCPWWEWPLPLRSRDPVALAEVRQSGAEGIRRHAFGQFLFFRQWDAMRSHARRRGIQIIGDIPIFVAYDSSDVWASPGLFHLDRLGALTCVAGVPPDYFSPTGQLWGNPLYRWDVHRDTGYRWWLERFRSTMKMVDIIRLDHFRGFDAYWEIPAGLSTAEIGRWAPGPGAEFLQAMADGLGSLPLIAEDLGRITPAVEELRDSFDLPGMKILQFAFASGPDDGFLPHNYPVNCVAYTGTHDNDTTLGWYLTAPAGEQDLCRRYLETDGREIAWQMVRAVWSSVARIAVAPLQDLLGLGTEARMNYPGRLGGNWAWRMSAHALDDSLRERLSELNYLYGRGTISPA